jgi:hypothetical protein
MPASLQLPEQQFWLVLQNSSTGWQLQRFAPPLKPHPPSAQVPQFAVREVPQLSFPVTLPQVAALRLQKVKSFSGWHGTQIELSAWSSQEKPASQLLQS